MKILLDFDDVLLNTRKFRRDYKKLYASYGINSEIFEKYYRKVVTREKGIVLYDPERHLKELETKENIKTTGLRKSIYNFARSSKNYIFKDVKSFLLKFKKSDLFIITHSKSKFQQTKLKSSGLKKYVDRAILSGKLKSYAVDKLKKGKAIKAEEVIYFIDDRIVQIDGVKKKNPGVITVLLRRKEGRYYDEKTKYCDYVAKNLKEAEKIICKLMRNYE